MTEQQLRELEYYKSAGENIYKIYNDFYQLSLLDYKNSKNITAAVNLLKSKYPEGNYLKGIESPAQFKKMIKENLKLYSGILKTFEEKYNKLYEEIYFPVSVHNVYFGNYKKKNKNQKKK